MQTLHQEIDPSLQGLTPDDHPVLRGLDADQARAHAEEVRLLRQRVAVLEAALAAAEGKRAHETTHRSEAPAVMSIDFAPPCPTQPIVPSAFSTPVEPAVVSVAPAPRPVEGAVSSPSSFAEAWTGGEPTFEERIAEKAFFQASTVDEQSRNWLLDD